MRRVLAVLMTVLVAASAAASSASAAGAMKLTPAGQARFPYRSFVLGLPSSASVSPDSVTVTENGKPVPGLTVTSSSANVQRRFGVVLVIDASRSMTHKPIASAMAAARAFAKHRNGQVPLGVVTFNSTSVARLPLTTDSAKIDQALAQAPPLARETHVYDAVNGAIAMLHRAGASAGSVVVLSDGADTGSRAKASDVVHWSREYGIRVYSVGLHSGAFDPSGLRTLAAGSLGEYAEAGAPEQLRPIYDQLGVRIASEYLITYRSMARPHKRVIVRAHVAGGGTATAQYNTPALSHTPGGSVSTTSVWASPAMMVLIALLCAGLLAACVALLLRPNPNSIRKRIAHFVGPVSTDSDRDGRSSGLATRALSGAEESLEGIPWWERFKEDLEIAQIRIPAVHLLLWTFVGTVGLFALAVSVTGSAVLAILTLGAPIGVRTWVKWKLGRQRKLFAEQLADTLQVVASAMRAGHSFAAALAMGVEDAPEPTRKELRRVVVEERLGIPLEESLAVVARRMDSPELEQVIVVTMLQRQTGGNTAEVLEHVTASIRERMELRRSVQTLTAQGRISRYVLTVIPPGLLVVMFLLNPTYMEPLLKTSGGHVMLVIAAALIFMGSAAIKRMVDIKV